MAERQVMWCEGLGLLCLELESRRLELNDVFAPADYHLHYPGAAEQRDAFIELWRLECALCGEASASRVP